MTKTITKVHPASIDFLSNLTWEYAQKTLWENQRFTKSEVEISKAFIKEYYEMISPENFSLESSRHFRNYCERIRLAKEYVNRHPWRYIPHPTIWLNKHNPKGFAGTKNWKVKKESPKPIYVSVTEHIFFTILDEIQKELGGVA